MLLTRLANLTSRASILISVLSILQLATAASIHTRDDLSWVPFDRTQFSGSSALDTKGDVQVFWKTGSNESTFGVASKSSGYLALGFSQTGAMTGGDMAVGYKNDNGDFVLDNMYATGFITPQLSPDQKENMQLVEGHQADGVTAFIFKKQNLASCLETQQDVLVDGWQWFIYSHSDSNTFAQHGPGDNGKEYVHLGTGKVVSTNSDAPIPDTKTFTVQQHQVTIPTDETTYCYSLHKMPTGKNWMVGERPLDSSKLLHHLVLYACYDLPDSYMDMLGKDPNCDYKTFQNPCTGFVTEWAPGMSARTFESGYGKPFGPGHYEYVMMEVHYNNPDHLSGVKDTANYELLYNDKPVQTEIGTLTLGDLQVSGWFLPPGRDLVKHSTTCTPECTNNWPSGGITAVSVFHHMHYRGVNAEVRVIRDGKEIAPLSVLRDFDYGYQFSKNLPLPQLLPGDRLITTCEFNTSNDTKPVPGGLPSEDEMCFAWVDYYPANSVLACTQYDLGSSPKNPVNGTAALCLESNDSNGDFYKSSALGAPFQHLAATGDVCPASVSSSSSPNGAGAILQTCPEDDVCFAVNVPEESASAGSGDIFFQLSAPTSYSWVALGQGTQMSNANIFVMYSSADGNNITLSPRTTTRHVMPTHDSAAEITLLDGTGIVDGKMVANVRCSNCDSWSTGTMDLSDSNSGWIYAHLSGPAIDSDDLNADISQHDANGAFNWDLSQATGGSSADPFTAAGATTSTSSSSGSSWSSMSSDAQNRLIQAHGTIASIAFVAIMPIGAILIRLASFQGLLWVHAGVQVSGYALFIAAAGLGIFIAKGEAYLNEPHAIIGLLLLAVFFLMPFLGVIHHKVYKRIQMRSAWSYAHIFTGRVGVVIGMINGGLGLKLADAGTSATIAYGVVAGLMAITYISAAVVGESRRNKKPPVCSEVKQAVRDDDRSGVS